jgi:NAD(P)-dependent dehydrogenase (short-subunit alcohol dehydrogenase family)
MPANAEAPSTVLITGGQGDLGKAVAAELKAQGWSVLSPGRQELDVADAASVESFFNGLAKLDLVVHCAGVLRDRMVTGMTDEEFATVLDVNLKGAFRVSQAALKLMAKQRLGHLVFVGSNSARYGTAGQANYAAAKAGLIGLTHSLAKEYGARNVRVNCILPGLLKTKMTAHLSDEVLEGVRAAHTLGRFNTCAEAAKFIAFLHHELPHTSGQVFQIDSRVNRWT